MKCSRFIYSAHSLQAVINRNILVDDVEVITNGETIANYNNDKPYPSKLMLKFINGRPLHVVVAQNPDIQECIVVTSYIPDPLLWNKDFKQKIK